MVYVTVSESAGTIRRILCSGHAGSAEYGQDLVCSGISSIVISGCNAIDALYPAACRLKVQEGYASIELRQEEPGIELVLLFLAKQLESIAQAHPGYIIYNRKEV